MARSGPVEPPARWVIDSSVVVKWFNPDEEEHASALEVRDRHLLGITTGVVPDLLMYEVANALHQAGHDPPRTVRAVTRVNGMGLEIMAFDLAVLLRACQLASDTGVAVYDAYFVALAERLDAPLVTADERMLRRLREYRWVLPLRAAVGESSR